MNLLELCEPLFQYVCRLNRSGRKGGNYEFNQVRAELKALLADLKAKSATQVDLVPQFDKIELPLLFFIDFMVKESALPFAHDWKEFAFERNELAGDEKFFDLLEETLKDATPAATERLKIFYQCIGLGFTGWYTGQPEYLRRKMKEIAARTLGGTDSGGDVARICPEAYENVDTRDLIEPPGTKLLGIGIALLGLILVLFIAIIYLYKSQTTDMSKALNEINDRAPAVALPANHKESK